MSKADSATRLSSGWQSTRGVVGGYAFRSGCRSRHLPWVVKVVSLRYYIDMFDEYKTPDRIAELLVHMGRAARSEDGRSALTAAQWTCLRFFARANSPSRTPSAFARFQGTTRGTASQIVKSLEDRGLILRARSERDRRSTRFDVTETGRAMLDNDPLRGLTGVIGTIDGRECDRFLETLVRLASGLASLRGVSAFGTCRDCSHFVADSAGGYCACMAAELAAGDIDRLCASFAPLRAVQIEGRS